MSTKPSGGGHTLLELLFVTAILGILMMITLPVIHKAQVRAKRASCGSQLHQVGIAEHAFAHDHHDQFPHQVSTNDGGTREFAHAGFAMSGEFFFAYRHFQALSNFVDSPKVLRCPDNPARTPATTFPELRNQHISYFAGLGADYTRPDSWLSGDGGLEAETLAGGAILRLTTNTPPRWAADCHDERGNLLFADGRVESVGTTRLAAAAAGPTVAYLLPPFVPPNNDSVVVQNTTVVSTLEQYFQSQGGGAAPALGGDPIVAVTAPSAAAPKPAGEAVPPAPRQVMARPAAKPGAAENATLAAQTTNAAARPAAALAPAKPAASTSSTAKPGSVSDSSGLPINVFVFVTRPERNPGWWLLLLVLVIAAAFGLGWRVQRERARRKAALSPSARFHPA